MGVESSVGTVSPSPRPPTAAGFADDVRRGLCATPKTLEPKYFYDELGSHLFAAICALPEYYLTRAETAILSQHAREMVAGPAPPVRLIELGSGDAVKTRYLIEALLTRQPELEYLADRHLGLCAGGEQPEAARRLPGAARAAAGGRLSPGVGIARRRAGRRRGRAGTGALPRLDPRQPPPRRAPPTLLRDVRAVLPPGTPCCSAST